MLRALTTALAVAVALLIATLLYHAWRTGQLQHLLQTSLSERSQWQQLATAEKARADRLAKQQQAANAAVQTLQAELANTDARYRSLQQRIANAPASDNGAVAPVLRQALEGLP
ncbi:hypothetical protein [Spongiibacter sp. UBA1325]|uniref:hypothetical protein n=1 Tax=Spongiibacter sp. UBA1325 TaxID=1947543 RepID=UPI002579A105|nr:hypothetical protein [Spongiibacter sp. UBA1325]|tara:strand:+ start:274 stop:615 length:342 start_codon:yes stop_codon:yes gene_type:complete